MIRGVAPALTGAQEIRYFSDPNGQFVGVIDTDGSAASHVWDPNGSRLGITHTGAGSVPIPVEDPHLLRDLDVPADLETP